MSAKLVSIIGPVAAGKTTLAELLGRELPACVVYEDYRGNPFLAESLAGEKNLALPSQVYFLLSRAKQLLLAGWPTEGVRVSDFGFCQDRLYAEMLLDGDDLRFYDHLARQVEPRVAPPAVLVRLDARVETLLDRIRRRGRAFERGYSAEYLRRLRDKHLDAPRPTGCACIVVDCEKINLLASDDAATVVRQVREALT
jgi:deoxyguanosine kinase